MIQNFSFVYIMLAVLGQDSDFIGGLIGPLSSGFFNYESTIAIILLYGIAFLAAHSLQVYLSNRFSVDLNTSQITSGLKNL